MGALLRATEGDNSIAAQLCRCTGRGPRHNSRKLIELRVRASPVSGGPLDGAMEEILLRVFVCEIEHQTRIALQAARDLDEALASSPNLDRVWAAVQGLLIAAGNLSKMFWPPSSGAAARGAELRTRFRIPADSPIQDRTFRNHFEHFDERLEAWATSPDRRHFVDSCVGSPALFAAFTSRDCLRNLNPQDMVLTFRGETYPLKPVIAAIRSLSEEAKRQGRAV